MRIRITVTSLTCSALLIISGFAIADSAAISMMADITMSLNHYPSDSDKQRLSTITESDESSDAEQAVAMAILNMQHRVKDADKAKLNAIIGDESAPARLRELAGVLVSINHSPSASDVEKLAAIVADSG